jgi:hypothetical protein
LMMLCVLWHGFHTHKVFVFVAVTRRRGRRHAEGSSCGSAPVRRGWITGIAIVVGSVGRFHGSLCPVRYRGVNRLASTVRLNDAWISVRDGRLDREIVCRIVTRFHVVLTERNQDVKLL